MYTNPYMAQKYAEMKIREAERWAEVERKLAEAQPNPRRTATWGVVTATAILGIVGALSGFVDRLTAAGGTFR